MGTKAAIYLDNPWFTYYAGQTVNGRIEYIFQKPIEVRGIHVTFKGEAKTEWTVFHTWKRRQLSTVVGDYEEYFEISYYLLGSDSGGEIQIPAGKNVYNFTCTLPPVLPSTFEGQHGYVSYNIKVTLHNPQKTDFVTQLPFNIVNDSDLNLVPFSMTPIHMQIERTFWCYWCTSRPVCVDVRAPVSGYCPGQVIPVQVDVVNESTVSVHLVIIYFRKVVKYTSKELNKRGQRWKTTDIEVLLTMQEGPAPAGTTKHWVLKLKIPPIHSSGLVNCSIIKLYYDLQVECVVSCIHSAEMIDKAKVTIGTVPLVGGVSPPSSPNQPSSSART